jgi:hypothetical protein
MLYGIVLEHRLGLGNSPICLFFIILVLIGYNMIMAEQQQTSQEVAVPVLAG